MASMNPGDMYARLRRMVDHDKKGEKRAVSAIDSFLGEHKGHDTDDTFFK